MDTVFAKSILTRNKSLSWFGCEFNMNLYRGCTHGCLYCDSRSDCYQVGDFGTVRAKQDALRILRDELAHKVKKGVVATGAMSDPYNPFEEKQQLTRHALELLNAYGFGAAIATKSDLIARDADILAEIHQHSPVLCKLTVTCGDDLAQKLEPHAPAPSRRFAAMEKLAAAGLFCGTLLMPVMPYLADSDENILEIVQNTYNAGGRFIYAYFGVTLRAAFPAQGLNERYRRHFGERYHCGSPRARHLHGVFTAACERLGIVYNMPDIIRAYRGGRESGQLSLFPQPEAAFE